MLQYTNTYNLIPTLYLPQPTHSSDMRETLSLPMFSNTDPEYVSACLDFVGSQQRLGVAAPQGCQTLHVLKKFSPQQLNDY